jgi:hypothetical protein
MLTRNRWAALAAALALSAAGAVTLHAPAGEPRRAIELPMREPAPSVAPTPARRPLAPHPPHVADSENASAASVAQAPALQGVARAGDDTDTAPLDVEFDGRRLVWTKEDVEHVVRAGGTHDVRELAAALLGESDVRVTVTGITSAGSASARVDLSALGSEDELRMWPERDGTWSVARNVSREQGRAIHEQYRLEEVLGLEFARR